MGGGHPYPPSAYFDFALRHAPDKCLQRLHHLALHLEIEGYTTLLLYLLLEFLSTGDLRGERRTFKWFLKRAESEKVCFSLFFFVLVLSTALPKTVFFSLFLSLL